MAEPPPEPQGRAPRIARLLALAHKLDALVGSGAITDYAELARLGHISPARVTQIMVLLHLAPAIQEYLLFLPAGDARFITELGLRKIARGATLGPPAQTFRAASQELTCLGGQTELMNVLTRQPPPKEDPSK